MKFRLATILLTAALLTGCPQVERKNKKAKGPNNTEHAPIPTKDQSADVTFQSFVGRLKIAVAKKDLATLASMMAPDFGYRWDTPPKDEDVFAYWESKNLWGELNALLSDRWVPYDGYMVVPPQLATDPEYRGYRAGLQQIDGSWRFAYFVPSPPAQ